MFSSLDRIISDDESRYIVNDLGWCMSCDRRIIRRPVMLVRVLLLLLLLMLLLLMLLLLLLRWLLLLLLLLVLMLFLGLVLFTLPYRTQAWYPFHIRVDVRFISRLKLNKKKKKRCFSIDTQCTHACNILISIYILHTRVQYIYISCR